MKNQFLELSTVDLPAVHEPLKVLLLADDGHPANVVSDYINSLVVESSHHIHLINPITTDCPERLSKKEYDAILIHYSICITEPYFLSDEWVRIITHFDGVKAQIVQDEYRWINKMKTQMCCLGIQVVFSSLTPENAKLTYGGDFMAETKVISCLPGYFSKRILALPLKRSNEREYDVIYRGRELPWSTGKHGKSKESIATSFSSWTKGFDLTVNIQTSEAERIYGEDWDNFLMSGKSMLGVEGGASIFDFDGTLEIQMREFAENNPEADLFKYWSDHLEQFEGNVVHKTITPKIFEAIAARTALILIPGEYSKLLEPFKHYIPLLENGSNIKEVIEKLEDQEFIDDLVETTYNEIAKREDLAFGFLVNKIDQILSELQKISHVRTTETYFKERLTAEKVTAGKALREKEEASQEILELKHNLNSTSQYLEMSRDTEKQLKSINGNLNQLLQDTQKQLQDTQKQLQDTQKQLQDTQKQLQDTQKQLQDTQKQLGSVSQFVKSFFKKLGNFFTKILRFFPSIH